jgi:hypothetical protein
MNKRKEKEEWDLQSLNAIKFPKVTCVRWWVLMKYFWIRENSGKDSERYITNHECMLSCQGEFMDGCGRGSENEQERPYCA